MPPPTAPAGLRGRVAGLDALEVARLTGTWAYLAVLTILAVWALANAGRGPSPPLLRLTLLVAAVGVEWLALDLPGARERRPAAAPSVLVVVPTAVLWLRSSDFMAAAATGLAIFFVNAARDRAALACIGGAGKQVLAVVLAGRLATWLLPPVGPWQPAEAQWLRLMPFVVAYGLVLDALGILERPLRLGPSGWLDGHVVAGAVLLPDVALLAAAYDRWGLTELVMLLGIHLALLSAWRWSTKLTAPRGRRNPGNG